MFKMVKIAGYARQKEPKWFYTLLISAVLFVIVIGVIAVAAIYSWMENESVRRIQAETTRPAVTTTILSREAEKPALIVRSFPITVEKIVFTSEINEHNQPVDDLASVSLKEKGMVYCYTRVNSRVVPQEIRHVWINPSGAVAADIKLNISRRRADTWSYISLLGTKPGRWELQIKTADGKVVGKNYLIVVND